MASSNTESSEETRRILISDHHRKSSHDGTILIEEKEKQEEVCEEPAKVDLKDDEPDFKAKNETPPRNGPLPMTSPQDIVLSYHDVLIRRSDLATLENHNWLNDTIIGFYFDYLEREECSNASNAGKIVFASPELTQLLKLIEAEDFPAILDGRITRESDYVFFPLNNSEDREAAGGAHWSLLIYSRAENSCFHLDSSSGFNRTIAEEFSGKILKFLGSENTNFKELSCPQQNNSYDCGIFVLCYSKIILEGIKIGRKISECDLRKAEEERRTFRTRVLKLILGLSKRVD